MLFDPVLGGGEWAGVEADVAFAAVGFDLDEAGGLQDAQVFRDAGERHLERFGEGGHRGITFLGEPAEDGAPDGVGERLEGGVEVEGLVNQSVECYPWDSFNLLVQYFGAGRPP